MVHWTLDPHYLQGKLQARSEYKRLWERLKYTTYVRGGEYNRKCRAKWDNVRRGRVEFIAASVFTTPPARTNFVVLRESAALVRYCLLPHSGSARNLAIISVLLQELRRVYICFIHVTAWLKYDTYRRKFAQRFRLTCLQSKTHYKVFTGRKTYELLSYMV